MNNSNNKKYILTYSEWNNSVYNCINDIHVNYTNKYLISNYKLLLNKVDNRLFKILQSKIINHINMNKHFNPYVLLYINSDEVITLVIKIIYVSDSNIISTKCVYEAGNDFVCDDVKNLNPNISELLFQLSNIKNDSIRSEGILITSFIDNKMKTNYIPIIFKNRDLVNLIVW